jgi:hypothetical protein
MRQPVCLLIIGMGFAPLLPAVADYPGVNRVGLDLAAMVFGAALAGNPADCRNSDQAGTSMVRMTAGNCDNCAANEFPRIGRSFEEIRATLLKKI